MEEKEQIQGHQKHSVCQAQSRKRVNAQHVAFQNFRFSVRKQTPAEAHKHAWAIQAAEIHHLRTMLDKALEAEAKAWQQVCELQDANAELLRKLNLQNKSINGV